MPRTDNYIQDSKFKIQDARSEHILKRAARIRLLISDVDGVLTDGSITYTSSGEEIKTFSVLDGLGIRLLMEAGVKFCILSSRSSAVTARRAEELGIDLVFQGVGQKLPASRCLLNELGLSWEAVAYVGDDLVDLPVLRSAGLAVTVPNCAQELKGYCHYITKIRGGHGAIREVAELILKAKNLWTRCLDKFLGDSIILNVES